MRVSGWRLKAWFYYALGVLPVSTHNLSEKMNLEGGHTELSGGGIWAPCKWQTQWRGALSSLLGYPHRISENQLSSPCSSISVPASYTASKVSVLESLVPRWETCTQSQDHVSDWHHPGFCRHLGSESANVFNWNWRSVYVLHHVERQKKKIHTLWSSVHWSQKKQ